MFPIKDNLRCLTFPLVTAILIVLNGLAFIWELQLNASAAAPLMNSYMMVPAKFVAAFQSGDPHLMLWAAISVFTAMFLHGGYMHLFGNMVFLFTFGKAVEARMGSIKYLAFYLLAGVSAALIHVASDPSSVVPTLGASGAIAGVLGAYLLLWPKAQVKGIVPPFLYVSASAYWFLPSWILMQLISIFQSGGNLSGGGVAYWAHVGGFAFGFIVAGIIKVVAPHSETCYIPTDCPPCDKPEDEEDEEDGEV